MPLDDIHALGGLRKEEIERQQERLDSRISALEKTVCANGRPGLEDRMKEYVDRKIDHQRTYIDERDNHKQATAMQAIQQVNTLVEYKLNSIERTSSERHEENKQKLGDNEVKLDRNEASINAINVKLGFAVGAATVIQIAVAHFWK